MYLKYIIAGLMVVSPLQMAGAESLSLAKVWTDIHTQSLAQKSADLQIEAATEAKDHASYHWLPRVYLDVKSYKTNDPGQSFFGLLEQRSVRQNDFNPDSLNQPEAQLYTRGALGVDLPLYEGGVKSAQYGLQEHTAMSFEKISSGVQVEQYSNVAKAYGSIGVLGLQKKKLEELSQIIERLLKSYQLGVKANPIGYSGLLGLKSLANRLQGLIVQYEAQNQAYYSVLKEMGLENSNWSVVFDDSAVFVEKYLSTNKEASSYQVESLKENSIVAAKAAEMEKARYRPKIGAFAEGYAFNGERDTANGYTAGLYLQWSLFNPSDYGAGKEAKLKSLAAEKYSKAMEQKERAEKKSLDQTILALKQNIKLLNESQKILSEQTRVTETLFKNGSINALQFVEVLSRRADVVVAQTEADLNLIKSASEGILKTRFELPTEISENAGKGK